MDPKQQEVADQRFDEALAQEGGRDPREFYRDLLRELKSSGPEAYDQAVAYYGEVLIPSIARGEAEPLAAWLEYGRRLCQLTSPGETVEIDASGVRHPHVAPTPKERMVLHIPAEKRARALVVGLPLTPTPAQRATLELLVQGRLKLRPAAGP